MCIRDRYKDILVTFTILKKLYTALEKSSLRSTNFDYEYDKLLIIHIDHALVNMDFPFAFNMTKELLEREMKSENDDLIRDHWLTIFQVGKFVDPNWLDNEIPTEILMSQMEVLAELLNVCPVEEIEIITSHWSGLELELSARDLVKDKYSLAS